MCSSCACADVKRERAVVNTRINIIRHLVLLYRGGTEPKTIQLPADVLCSESGRLFCIKLTVKS